MRVVKIHGTAGQGFSKVGSNQAKKEDERKEG
jgi:hypothetical protein